MPPENASPLPELDLERAIDHYADDCLSRIPEFVNQHLGWRGAWRLNRHALGWDLLRVPVNIAWAPFWLLLQLISWVVGRSGAPTVAGRLASLPAGMATEVQRQLAATIEQDLLGIYADQPDPLLRSVVEYAAQQEHAEHDIDWEEWQASAALDLGRAQLRSRLFGARTAVAEITTNISMAAVGAVVFKQFTPGALGGGAALAAWYSWDKAVSEFWAGETLGRVWFGWFPPETDITARLAATAVLMAILALVASLSGFVTDPLQTSLGLHQRRLVKLVEQMRRELKSQLLGNSRMREQYLARLTDVLDWLAIAGRGL